MAHEVKFRPGAIQNLERIHTWVFDAAGPRVAMGFVQQIIEQCHALADMPERAPLRPQVGHDVRILIWKRHVSIAYRIRRKQVEILRIFSRGQLLANDPGDE